MEIIPERELLAGRTIIVTGAASGLGRGSAYLAAYQGATLALVDLNEAGIRASAESITKTFPNIKVSTHKCDITNEDAVEALFAEVVAEHKTIQGLAHCAGIFGAGKEISQQSLSAFELELKVNTTGTFLLNKHCVRVLQKQNADGVPVPTGGYSIVNIGSKASTAGNREAVAYIASKHAVLGISRVVAIEQAQHHIRCNCVCPGPVDTPLTRQGANIPATATLDEMNARLVELGILDKILLKRMGQPEDIAHQVTYLLGPRSQFVTHGLFTVDGGWL